MNKFDFYKENYYKELERKISLDNALSIPIGIIIALATLLIQMFINFKYDYSIIQSVVFIICFIISFIFLALSIKNILKSYHLFKEGYEYQYLYFMNTLENYYKKLEKFHKKSQITKVNNDYEKYITKILVTCTSNNAKKNDEKAYYIFRSKKYLIKTILSLILIITIYSLNYLKTSNISKETLINTKKPLEIHLDTAQLNQIKNGDIEKMATQSKKPTPIKKPKEPPVRKVQEGVNPKNSKKNND